MRVFLLETKWKISSDYELGARLLQCFSMAVGSVSASQMILK